MCGAQCVTKSNVSRDVNSLGPNFVRLTILLACMVHGGAKRVHEQVLEHVMRKIKIEDHCLFRDM